MAFAQMENIEKFLKACQNYGMNKVDCFQVVDLYEAQNPWNVIGTIYALGRKVGQLYWVFYLVEKMQYFFQQFVGNLGQEFILDM